MERILSIKISRYSAKVILFDLSLLLLIYFLPAVSHLTAIPFYMLEPMRIALMLTLVHTNRRNAFIIAITLPLFSYFLSSHPVIYKSLIVSIELLVNAVLFYYLLHRINYPFLAMFASIIAAKACYYLLKLILLNVHLIGGDLISTPVLLQLIISILISVYAALMFRKRFK